VIYSYVEAKEMQHFSALFIKELYMLSSSMSNKQNEHINIRTQKKKCIKPTR